MACCGIPQEFDLGSGESWVIGWVYVHESDNGSVIRHRYVIRGPICDSYLCVTEAFIG